MVLTLRSYVVWPLATALYAQIPSARQTELVAAIAARHLVHRGSFTMCIRVRTFFYETVLILVAD